MLDVLNRKLLRPLAFGGDQSVRVGVGEQADAPLSVGRGLGTALMDRSRCPAFARDGVDIRADARDAPRLP